MSPESTTPAPPQSIGTRSSTGTYTSTSPGLTLDPADITTIGERGPETINVATSNTVTTLTNSGGGSITTTITTDEAPPPRRKIALVGFTGSRRQAPYDDPEWELWGLNNLHRQEDIDTAKFHAWFDLHDAYTVDSMPAHSDWLKAGADGLPVYMFQERPEFPTVRQFPADDVLAAFPAYFTNSVSWMTALAILVLKQRCAEHGWAYEDCEIGIWGIDMAEGGDGEYARQRPSCEFYVGLAMGLGFTVTIAHTSDLLKTAMQYGLEDSPLIAKMHEQLDEHRRVMGDLQAHHTAKLQELALYTEQKTAEIRYVEAQLNNHNGAANQLLTMLGTWAPPGNHGNSTHEDEGKAAA